MKPLTTILSAIAFAATSSLAVAQGTPATPASVHVMNGMFTDAKGMTLYTFDRDTAANKSSCTGQCLTNWPVLKATADDKDVGDWKVIALDDRSKAWAYKGKPLYYYAMDKAPGDMTGDGRGKVWHVAKP